MNFCIARSKPRLSVSTHCCTDGVAAWVCIYQRAPGCVVFVGSHDMCHVAGEVTDHLAPVLRGESPQLPLKHAPDKVRSKSQGGKRESGVLFSARRGQCQVGRTWSRMTWVSSSLP